MRSHAVVGGDGMRLAAHAVGDERAPVALIGHGVGSSSEFVLDAIAPALVSAGWQVVAHDLRGHGVSAPCRHPSAYDLTRLVADVTALADVFTPRVVGGVSLSAHAAVAYALTGTADLAAAVACLPAWSGTKEPGEGPHAAVADNVDRVGVDAAIAGFATDDHLRPWLRDVLIRDWSRHDPDSLRAALRSLDGGTAPDRELLRALKMPLALVGWPDDPGHPIEVAEAWADAAPEAALETIGIDDIEDDLTAFGHGVVRALGHLGVRP